jgi:DNA-directed RNA polymerase subunit RPC12/RpoP
MGKYASSKELKKFISSFGFIYIRDFFDKNRKRYIDFKDTEGYLYSSYVYSLKKSFIPSKISERSKFSIINIKRFLKNNNKSFYLKRNFKNYKGRSFKISFTCKNCKEDFESTWSQVERGDACPYCSNHRPTKEKNLLSLYPIVCLDWDYKKNKNILPESILPQHNKKVFWKCHVCHHEWFTSPNSRVGGGRGCPECAPSSKGEVYISKLLKDMNIKFLKQHKFPNCKNRLCLIFDFYLPDYNMCIEYNGKQHYEPIEFFGGIKTFKELQINDNIKKDYCKKNKIDLLILSYKEDKNIEKILSKNINIKEVLYG